VRFSQLFTNLIKNSQESAQENELNIGIITTLSETTDNALIIKFVDNGHGFNEKILEHQCMCNQQASNPKVWVGWEGRWKNIDHIPMLLSPVHQYLWRHMSKLNDH
jgi:light-regulated signal transduction histidine kinase (bacteriophytochrome)